MFVYEKKLQFPVKIANPNPKYAQIIISQYGGPDGELGASLRYLSQRYSMPYPELKGLLTDVATSDTSVVHLEQKAYIFPRFDIFADSFIQKEKKKRVSGTDKLSDIKTTHPRTVNVFMTISAKYDSNKT